jgi:DNA-binding NarL/FixJ family response regulator
MAPIRILLANHQPIIRSGLRLLLERDTEFRVVAEAANGREAIVLTDFTHPDIVLLEVTLPVVNGISVTREIAREEGCARAIFVTAHTEESYVVEAFKAGARGYVAGDSAPADLTRAIHAVADGRAFLSPAVSMDLLDGAVGIGGLSEYETQIYCCLAEGYEEQEIAVRLNADVNKIRSDCRAIVNVLVTRGLPEVIAKSLFAN